MEWPFYRVWAQQLYRIENLQTPGYPEAALLLRGTMKENAFWFTKY
jgi:hypothetical protein